MRGEKANEVKKNRFFKVLLYLIIRLLLAYLSCHLRHVASLSKQLKKEFYFFFLKLVSSYICLQDMAGDPILWQRQIKAEW